MSIKNLVFVRQNKASEGFALIQIADDPIIRSMERWGLPPWLLSRDGLDMDEQEEDEYVVN